MALLDVYDIAIGKATEPERQIAAIQDQVESLEDRASRLSAPLDILETENILTSQYIDVSCRCLDSIATELRNCLLVTKITGLFNVSDCRLLETVSPPLLCILNMPATIFLESDRR